MKLRLGWKHTLLPDSTYVDQDQVKQPKPQTAAGQTGIHLEYLEF